MEEEEEEEEKEVLTVGGSGERPFHLKSFKQQKTKSSTDIRPWWR